MEPDQKKLKRLIATLHETKKTVSWECAFVAHSRTFSSWITLELLSISLQNGIRFLRVEKLHCPIEELT